MTDGSWIRINSKMVDALGMTIEINGRQALILSHPTTQAALSSRGLADGHGYLTVQGEYVAWFIRNGGGRRSWTPQMLEDKASWWAEGRQNAED